MSAQHIKINYTGYKQAQAAIDLFLCPGNEAKVALFYHGFKGFKDWGAWQAMVPLFTQAGLSIALINGTHNGVIADGQSFDDLEKFSNNTLQAEQTDLTEAWAHIEEVLVQHSVKMAEQHMIGHSRGAAAALIYTSVNSQIKSLSMWAGISNYDSLFKFAEIEKWAAEGVFYIKNARTGQSMPINYAVWEEYQAHKLQYDLHTAASKLGTNLLIVHGEQDEVVPILHAEELYNLCLHSILIRIPNANHTFNCTHPHTSSHLPSAFLECVKNTVDFITDFEEDGE